MKLLLHGGVTSPRTEKNKNFFQAIVNAGGNKILIFPFSQKNRDYQLQFNIDKQKFIDHNPSIELEIDMASDNIKTLAEQIENYKSLYFCGGYQDHHLEVLDQINDLDKLLKNKIISGNSAGSMIWAKSFYSGDFCRNGDGLGYLNIKIMVHRGTDRYPGKYTEKDLESLKSYGEDFPIYKIREQEYEVFDI